MQVEARTLVKSLFVDVGFAVLAESLVQAADRLGDAFDGTPSGAKMLIFILTPLAAIGVWRILVLLGFAAFMYSVSMSPACYDTSEGKAFDIHISNGMIPAFMLRLVVCSVRAMPGCDSDQEMQSRQRQANGITNCSLAVFEDSSVRQDRETFSLGAKASMTVRLAHWNSDKQELWVLISEGKLGTKLFCRASKACLPLGAYEMKVRLVNWLLPIGEETFRVNVTDAGVASIFQVR